MFYCSLHFIFCVQSLAVSCSRQLVTLLVYVYVQLSIDKVLNSLKSKENKGVVLYSPQYIFSSPAPALYFKNPVNFVNCQTVEWNEGCTSNPPAVNVGISRWKWVPLRLPLKPVHLGKTFSNNCSGVFLYFEEGNTGSK